MVEAKFFTLDGKYISVYIEGHAEGFDGKEYDLICNSISVVAQTALYGIFNILDCEPDYTLRNGRFTLNLLYSPLPDLDKTQPFIEMMLIALKNIEVMHPKNLNITIEEVI